MVSSVAWLSEIKSMDCSQVFIFSFLKNIVIKACDTFCEVVCDINSEQ